MRGVSNIFEYEGLDMVYQGDENRERRARHKVMPSSFPSLGEPVTSSPSSDVPLLICTSSRVYTETAIAIIVVVADRSMATEFNIARPHFPSQ
jgi:hypothetical protein